KLRPIAPARHRIVEDHRISSPSRRRGGYLLERIFFMQTPASDLRRARREFLRTVAATLPLYYATRLPKALAAAEEAEARLIPRQKNPDNLEFPFATPKSFFTPNDLFFLRNHFPAPKLPAITWPLPGGGPVAKPFRPGS